MSLNINKCFHASFGNSDICTKYLINESIITPVLSFKNLGILVSSPLSFNVHVDSVTTRTFQRLGLIYIQNI